MTLRPVIYTSKPISEPSFAEACARVNASLNILAEKIKTERDALRPLRFDSHTHKGRKFKKKAVTFAHAVNALEEKYTADIFAAAAEITALATATPGNWHENASILNLWHNLAHTVTYFSEHPDNSKHVATLILHEKGRLHEYAANRTPEGLDKKGGHFTKGRRKNFIICSERIALSRLLQISLRGISKFSKDQKNDRYKTWQVEHLTTDIITAANTLKPALADYFVLTTASPCDACAPALAPHRPRTVLTCEATGWNFTRAKTLPDGLSIFGKHGVPLRYLPAPSIALK